MKMDDYDNSEEDSILTSWPPIMISFLVGVIFVIVFELLLLILYIVSIPKQPIPTSKPSKPELPENIEKFLQRNSNSAPLTSQVLNIVFQLLFQELRHTEAVRKWVIRKLNAELQELLDLRTTGKLFEQLVLSEFDMGKSVPMIKSLSVEDIVIDENRGIIKTVVLLLPIEYDGNFQIAVDSKLVLGQKVYVSIIVKKVVGTVRLQFNIVPFTHWSLCFIEDPYIDLEIKSLFHGREVSKVTSIIAHQIRRSVRKKHTFPSFKVRYKPFFPPDIQIYSDPAEYSLPEGKITVAVLELSRLPIAPDEAIFLCLGLDRVSWHDFHNKPVTSYETLEVKISSLKISMVTIYVHRKFIYEKLEFCTAVDYVTGPFCNVLPGDILVQINGKLIKTPNDLQRVSLSVPVVTLKIERRHKESRGSANVEGETKKSNHSLKSKSSVTPTKSTGLNIDVTAATPTSASSPSTPTGTESVVKRRARSDSRMESPKEDLPSNNSSASLLQGVDIDENRRDIFDISPVEFKVLSTNTDEQPRFRVSKLYSVENNFMEVQETFNMNISESSLYLNVCVKTLSVPGDKIVCLLSIPLFNLIVKCSLLTRGPFLKIFYLKPTYSTLKARKSEGLGNHPGFNPSYCYGDILLSCKYSKETVIPEESSPSSDNTTIESSISKDEPTLTGEPQKHDFVRAHFERGTLCEFCHKKIWLKEAFTCSNCNIPCHKKCTIKCMLLKSCSPTLESGYAEKSQESSYPEIITTQFNGAHDSDSQKDEDLQPEASYQWSQSTQFSTLRQRLYLKLKPNVETDNQATPRRSLNNLLSSVTSRGDKLKRAGSVTSLAPPSSSGTNSISRSLPPSPQHSPQPSRKGSLVGNPFTPNSDASDYDHDAEIQAAVERLIQYSHEEELVPLAKQTGKSLYDSLPIGERRLKLESLIDRLQENMNNKTLHNRELQLTLSTDLSESQRLDVTNEVTYLEAEIKALAILMLYYFSGLQHVLDLEGQTD